MCLFISGCAGVCCCGGFALVAESGGDATVAVHRLLTVGASLVGSTGSLRAGFSSYGTWDQ